MLEIDRLTIFFRRTCGLHRILLGCLTASAVFAGGPDKAHITTGRDISPPLPPGAIRRIGEDRFHHDSFVCDIALAVDGSTAYTVAGSAVFAWDLATGRLKWRSGGFRDPDAQRARIVEAGDQVIVAPTDLPGPVYALDRATGRQVGRWTNGDGPAELWAKVPPGDRRRYLIDGNDRFPGREGEGTFRDLGAEGKPITSKGGGGPWTFAVSSDGKTVALSLYWLSTPLYDIQTGKRAGNVRDANPDDSITPLAFSPDAKTLVTSTWRGGEMGVDARDVAGGAPRRLAQSHFESGANVPYAARFSFDGKLLAIGDGRTWEMREFATNRLLYALSAGRHSFQQGLGEFTRDRRWFVTLRDPYRLIVYDAATGRAAGPPTLPGSVRRLLWTADGRLVVLGDRAVASWEATTGRQKNWVSLPPDLDSDEPEADVAVAGGRVAYLAHRHTAAMLFDLRAGEPRPLDASLKGRASITISPDGSRVIVVYGDGFRELAASTGKVVRTLKGRKTWDRVCTFTPDGGKLVCVIDDGLSVWDVPTGRETRLSGQEIEQATVLAAMPGNRHVVAGLRLFDSRASKDRSYLSAWDITRGKQVTLVDLQQSWPPRRVPLRGGGTLIQDFRPTSLAGLPDSHHVAVGDSGGRVHVFEVLTGKLLRTLDSAPRNPLSETGPLAASPDGRYLASVCEGTILVWDLRSGKP